MSTHSDRLPTGVPGLDDILHGGLIRDRLYLVDGRAGSGKTTLAMQFLLEGAARGESALYLTLAETTAELLASAASHGWLLDGVDVQELRMSEGDLIGDDDLTILHPSEFDLFDVTRQALAAIDRANPQRVVIDSLSELRLLAHGALRYRRQVLALKQRLAGRACTVLMLDDGTAGGSDRHLHSIVAGVISLEQHRPGYGEVRRELSVVKFRGSGFESGLHDLAVRRGGLRVFPRLGGGRPERVGRPSPVGSGIAELDDLLGGGIDRGTNTLLLGPPGTGKSSIAQQFAASACARGERVAVFLFEETRASMLVRAEGLGMELAGAVESGALIVETIDPVSIAPGEFASRVRSSVEQHDARLVVIDSLNGYLKAMPNDDYLSAQLHELLSYLNHRGIATFVVVSQSGLIGEPMMSPIDISYLADTVVLFRYFEHGGSVHKALSVLKKRTGRHETAIRELRMGTGGVRLGEPLMRFRGILSGIQNHELLERHAAVAEQG